MYDPNYLRNNRWSLPSSFEPVAEELDSVVDLCLTQSMNDQRDFDSGSIKVMQVVVIVQKARASSPKRIIRANVFGMGEGDEFPQQLESFIEDMVQVLLIARYNQIGRLQNHPQ